MSLTLILIVIIVLLSFTAGFAIYRCIKISRKKRELEKEIEKKNISIAYLFKHAEEIAKLNSEKAKLEKEVENAKTDEEIAAIVDVVVTANNSKLHIN
ncbi:MAG: hypothetical protein IKF66_01180 [Methanobrevibacter sp.]|nr:hypothetical protein [Methanobrevibacter sp.]